MRDTRPRESTRGLIEEGQTMTKETEIIRVTLRAADAKPIWDGLIEFAYRVDQWGLPITRTLHADLLVYTGRDLLAAMTQTVQIELVVDGEPRMLLDDAETERIVQAWQRIAAKPDQIDWTGTPRPQPQW